MRADKIKLEEGKPCIDAPEEHWLKIEAALDFEKPNLPFRRRLARYVAIVLELGGPPTFREKGGPKLPPVKILLKKLIKDAKRLDVSFQ